MTITQHTEKVRVIAGRVMCSQQHNTSARAVHAVQRAAGRPRAGVYMMHVSCACAASTAVVFIQRVAVIGRGGAHAHVCDSGPTLGLCVAWVCGFV